MTATVTRLAGRHSWNVEPRADDPTRHIRTCKRDGCGLRKRSELVDGTWLELWLWPDGEFGDTGEGRRVPSCRAGQAALSQDSSSEPAVAPPLTAAVGAAVTGESAATRWCRRCNPPCGRPGRLHLGGVSCAEVVAAEGAATREWIRGMRSNGGAA
jgi:hypothetical protein